MAVNVALLREALAHITDHPERWDQAVWLQRWPCGTAGCLAGHVVLLSPYADPFWEGVTPNYDSAWRATLRGEVLDVDLVAQELLGIDRWDRERLFDPDNSLPWLWELAWEITDGEIEIPTQFQAGGSR